MKAFLNAATAALVLVAGAGIAQAAAGHIATGKLASVDASRHRIMLGHHIYRYAPSKATASLAPGQHVKVFFREGHGHRWAHRIVPMAG